jgi:uncharacterized protein GlcG (DUF336 family)
MDIAVVDAGDNPKAFARMDGTWLGSNDAQFNNPSGNINNSAFGVVTSANAPRIEQVAIKFLS